MSNSAASDERTPLLLGSPNTRRTAQLYSGELQEEERDNLNNELQEDSEYREEYPEENSDTESLIPEITIQLDEITKKAIIH